MYAALFLPVWHCRILRRTDAVIRICAQIMVRWTDSDTEVSKLAKAVIARGVKLKNRHPFYGT